MIVAVGSQKGGSGKSLLCTLLAGAFTTQYKKRVLIVDADAPQYTTYCWSLEERHREELPGIDVICRPDPDLHRAADLTEGGRYDAVFVDCPGRADAVLRSALVAANILVVPMQPSYPDAWALEGRAGSAGRPGTVGLADHVEAAQRARKAKLEVLVVVNRLKEGTTLGRQASGLQGSLPAGFRLLRSQLRDRADFQLAFGRGVTPLELNPQGKAAEDTRALARELRPYFFPKTMIVEEAAHAR